MVSRNRSLWLARAVAGMTLAISAVGCAQTPSQSGGSAGGQSRAPAQQGMMNAPMQNMQRIMMMPEAQRIQYVQNAQRDSLNRGKALFDNTRLGTNGQACASCHVGGRTTGGQVEMMPGMRMPIPDLHGVANTFPKFKVPNDAVITLAEMNNNCLVMFQAGTPLALDSQEARDLAAYVTSFSR